VTKEATERAILGQTFLSQPCFEHYNVAR